MTRYGAVRENILGTGSRDIVGSELEIDVEQMNNEYIPICVEILVIGV